MTSDRPFIGREVELRRLRSPSEALPASRISAIYGRRRVGKTRLVREACKGLRFFQFEGLEGQKSEEQKAHFLKTLHRYSGLESHRLIGSSDWEDLLIVLAEFLGTEPCVVLFDEFQWMAAGRSELVAKLKYVWDNFFKEKCRVHLILCGSVSSFIVRKVVRSKALFGRIEFTLNLQPLKMPEVKAGFFADRSPLEALEFYLVAGGIPTYLELLDRRQSVRLNLGELCFKPGAYFAEEIDRIFISHFGKPAHYRRIVEYLAGYGFASREAIMRHLDLSTGGRVSRFLEDLEMAGFIEGYAPLQKTTSRNLKRYRIADPCLRFYYRFIHPVRRKLASGSEGIPLHLALPDDRYAAYLGLAFENFCRQHAPAIARRLGFSAVAYDYGSFFGRGDASSGAQVDLIYKRADGVATVCEVKFRRDVGVEVIEEVERKLPALRQWFPGSVEKVLITAYPPSQTLIDQGYFSAILTADDMVRPTD